MTSKADLSLGDLGQHLVGGSVNSVATVASDAIVLVSGCIPVVSFCARVTVQALRRSLFVIGDREGAFFENGIGRDSLLGDRVTFDVFLACAVTGLASRGPTVTS